MILITTVFKTGVQVVNLESPIPFLAVNSCGSPLSASVALFHDPGPAETKPVQDIFSPPSQTARSPCNTNVHRTTTHIPFLELQDHKPLFGLCVGVR